MRVAEIFESIQGETTQAGRPCVFVRFAGCDLSCAYCDSTHARDGGRAASVEEILAEVAAFKARFVTLTGGEPLLQKELPELCRRLLDVGWEVSIETHGRRPLGALPAGVARIVDVKTPGSGVPPADLGYLGELRPRDEVKFVICSPEDFRWSLDVIRSHRLEGRVPILLSPAFGLVEPAVLVRWMLDAGVSARLNLQIHKVVWGPDARGV